MHPATFNYLSPTPEQTEAMNEARLSANTYADTIERLMPDGPDKTYVMRKLREVAMWVNIGITRQPDGAQRI